MLVTTRRHALALLLAGTAGVFVFTPLRRALAQADNSADDNAGQGDDSNSDSGGEAPDDAGDDEAPPSDEKEECYDSQKFGIWLAQASDKSAGARANDVAFTDPDKSALRADVRVSSTLDAKIVLYAALDDVSFSKENLIKPDNRLIVRDETGKERVNVALCGNCNDIEEDKFSLVMPLATAPLLRESPAIEIAFRLVGQPECGFKLELADMHKALDWAKEHQSELATKAAEGACVSPGDG